MRRRRLVCYVTIVGLALFQVGMISAATGQAQALKDIIKVAPEINVQLPDEMSQMVMNIMASVQRMGENINLLIVKLQTLVWIMIAQAVMILALAGVIIYNVFHDNRLQRQNASIIQQQREALDSLHETLETLTGVLERSGIRLDQDGEQDGDQ